MGSRLLLRAYILEGEQGRVRRKRRGISTPKDMIVISLLVVTVEVILGKTILQGNQCDWNSTGKGRRENLSLRPGACT